jgi:putative ABC transport system permease protein
MHETDETYTYLDATINRKANSQVKIMGIKNNSTYVDLTNKNNKNLNSLLDEEQQNGNYKIIVNAFAAHKYNLKEGSKVSFSVKNTTDRFSFNEDSTLSSDTSKNVTFTVVGVNKSAEGEEYFINQNVANYILGLKNDIDETIQPHQYYPRNGDSTLSMNNDHITMRGTFLNGGDLATSQQTVFGEKNSRDSTSADPRDVDPNQAIADLVDLSNETIFNKNATAYGFNGVFTKSENGGSLLYNRIPLYSPTGIYPGTAKVTDEVLDTLLKYGSNMQITSQILGL